MNPKKSNSLILEVAKDTNSNEQLVEDITSFYWTEVRRSLVEMRGHNIFVEGLGTFKAKSWKVPELLQKYERMLNSYKNKVKNNTLTFQQCTIMKEIEIKYEKVKRLQESLNSDMKKKKSVKEKRNEKA